MLYHKDMTNRIVYEQLDPVRFLFGNFADDALHLFLLVYIGGEFNPCHLDRFDRAIGDYVRYDLSRPSVVCAHDGL